MQRHKTPERLQTTKIQNPHIYTMTKMLIENELYYILAHHACIQVCLDKNKYIFMLVPF